ncbi:MAG TPA: hypothetical protein PKD74_03220 [Candidatus Dependentiae bacterium]|nr:hypothetical protein [Candidatus Dependentiae bacterium]
MNKIYFLMGLMLFYANTTIVSMADMGLAFRYFLYAIQPSCRVAKDIESHGSICKKRIQHVSYFVDDKYEYYYTQLSSDDWLVGRKDIAGMSEGAIVCLRHFRIIAARNWISLPAVSTSC